MHHSASFSATIRVRLEDRPGAFACLAATIGEAGGSLGAIDLVHLGGKRSVAEAVAPWTPVGALR